MTQLKNSRAARLAVTAIEGFNSALPLALVGGTLQAWLATEKINLQTIGWFSLVGLPYTWKFVWAPLFDRFHSIRQLGRRRGWIFIFQVSLIASIIALSRVSAREQIYFLGLIALFTAWLSASQDIVIDAYRTDLLEPAERGAGATAVNIGARIAHITVGAGALILSTWLSWQTIYFFAAVLMIPGTLITLIAPDPKPLPVDLSLSDASKLGQLIFWWVQPFKELFTIPRAGIILAFITLYKWGDSFAVALATPFLLTNGFTAAQVGALFKGVGMIATLLGSIVGGFGVTKTGATKALLIFGVFQAASNLGFLLLCSHPGDAWMLSLVIGFDQFSSGLGSTAFIAFLTSLCSQQFSGSQFAFLTSVMALSRVLVGPVAGYVSTHLGWTTYYWISFFLAFPGLILIFPLLKVMKSREA